MPDFSAISAANLFAGLVFGYAVVRADVLPRWTGVLLMLGMLSMVVATALPDVVQTGAAAIRDVAFAGMGAALLGVGIQRDSSDLSMKGRRRLYLLTVYVVVNLGATALYLALLNNFALTRPTGKPEPESC